MEKRANLTPEQLAKYFDHTLLRADATDAQMRAFCEDCARYGFAMAAINPAQVPLCVEALAGAGVRVGAAIGFPLGQNSIQTKLFETRQCLEQGADEIDYVVNLTRLKAGDDAYVADEMGQIVAACRQAGATSKVIFENCYLTEAEKCRLCAIARQVGIDFVKTSTGFGSGGATFEDVALMKAEVGDAVKVKAAGGVRTLADALRFIDLGVSRIGSTASIAIVEAYKAL